MNRIFSITANRVERAAGVVAASVAGLAGAVALASPAHAHHDHDHGGATPDVNHQASMFGNPSAAAPFWRRQQGQDCAEMAAADVIGQVTGHEPSERDIDSYAEHANSTVGSGPIYQSGVGTDVRDVPALLSHYGVKSTLTNTTTGGLEQDLAGGHKVIARVNSETLWHQRQERTNGDHLVVVTGIDAKSGVVHLNDSGTDGGRDEQIPIATFEKAWSAGDNTAVVTA